MRRPLPSRSVRTHLPLLLLDGLDLKLGQLIAAEGAADQKRQHDVVALGFQATPHSAGGGRERVRNAVKRVFRSIARNAGKGERGRRSVTTECDNRTRILAGGDIDFNVRKPPAQSVPLNFEPSRKD